ncbi:universal stress protein [Natronobacterium gregoryi]|nr:universal stress protein [Natronobacterium gregoryi]ELY70352.1 UspA domain-containing protein [Natronobacterium gregoryi SP2]PLK20820.1 universal stress protein [Natronobacterium gregoryi SP2]
MLDNILIATDGSDEASVAVEHGLDLAEVFGATVHVIYVVETEAAYILTIGVSDDEMKEYRQLGEEVVTDIVERAKQRGLDGVGVVKTGNISQEIVDYAQETDIDNVVVAERGRGTVEKYLGSNAENVVRMCSQPVTVVRSSKNV